MSPVTDPVWLDGTILPLEKARIAPDDRGLLLGDGLFETMRVASGKVCHPDRHLARLAEGCRTLMLPPPDLSLLQQAMTDLLEASALTNGSLRLTITRGCGPRGVLPTSPVRPTILIRTAPAAQKPSTPVRLGTSRYRKDEKSPLSSVKSLACLPFIMARMEAAASGLDDALLLATTGAVAESTTANILFLMHDTFLTPPLQDGPLPGIARSRLCESGLLRETSVRPEDISSMTAAWLVNALSLTPVISIDSHSLSFSPHADTRLRQFLFPV
ncbi:aminotransferase class IV [Acetobacter oeni]|nr:aminotransferase class IV [Acetobacter oeni]